MFFLNYSTVLINVRNVINSWVARQLHKRQYLPRTHSAGNSDTIPALHVWILHVIPVSLCHKKFLRPKTMLLLSRLGKWPIACAGVSPAMNWHPIKGVPLALHFLDRAPGSL